MLGGGAIEARRTFLKYLGGLIAALASSAESPAEEDAINAAAAALGVNTIHTLQFSGSGATFTVGQNFTPTDPWPRVTLKGYTALIDYEAGSMRQDMVRQMGATMP